VVVNSHGPAEGRFTFTSHIAGDHTICLATNATKSSTWFSSGSHVRLYLDVVVGNTKPDTDHDRSHVSQLAAKVRDLNTKLEDIRREQQYQREREADFRDLSEATNSKAVWYSIFQIGTLVATCFWQLRHLKVCEFSFHAHLTTLAKTSLQSSGSSRNDGFSVHMTYNVI
jgi:p24 family protein alpha